MARRKPFSQADVTNFLKAVRNAGINVGRVEVDAAGKIAVFAEGSQRVPQLNELDIELEQFEARRGQN